MRLREGSLSVRGVPGDVYEAERDCEGRHGRVSEVKNLAVERGGPVPLLRGRDILGLGVAPGPAVGKILAEVYEQQLDSKVQNRDQALAAAQRILVRCRLDIIPVVGPPSRDAGSGT